MRLALLLVLLVGCGGDAAPISADAALGAPDAPSPPADAAPAAADAAPVAGTDPNGVRQIYPTREGGAAPWTLGFGDWPARTRQWGDVTGEGASTIVTAAGQVRLTVKATTSDCEGDTDQALALERGWMCSPEDWTNYELTGYLRLDVAAGASQDMDWTFYGNGGRHTGSGAPTGCMGSSYKGSYHYRDAEVRVAKESWHVNYDFRPWTAVPGGIDYTTARDAWLGMKVIRYEFTRDGARGVRNEIWLDLGGVDAAGAPANDWFLALVEEDHPSAGSFGTAATDCGCPVDDQIMLWGGPWVTWRWDGTTSSIRLMSAREIVPPTE